jgi:hypothetical protein
MTETNSGLNWNHGWLVIFARSAFRERAKVLLAGRNSFGYGLRLGA